MKKTSSKGRNSHRKNSAPLNNENNSDYEMILDLLNQEQEQTILELLYFTYKGNN